MWSAWDGELLILIFCWHCSLSPLDDLGCQRTPSFLSPWRAKGSGRREIYSSQEKTGDPILEEKGGWWWNNGVTSTKPARPCLGRVPCLPLFPEFWPPALSPPPTHTHPSSSPYLYAPLPISLTPFGVLHTSHLCLMKIHKRNTHPNSRPLHMLFSFP